MATPAFGGSILSVRNQEMQESEPGTHERKHRPRGDLAGDILPLEEVERQAIIHALTHVKGDKAEAARRLGIGKSTLYRKLKRYGVQ
jgi:DNA-binding NtrC family response regulator